MHENQPGTAKQADQQSSKDTERRFAQWKKLIHNQRVLDIGCGQGDFILRAQDTAKSITGIEPENAMLKRCEKKRLNVFPELSSLPSSNKFDVITLFHVLEHMPDPFRELEKLHQYFFKSERSPKTLVIEVPSADDALLSLYENEAFSKFTYWSCHLYMFNESTLKKLAEKAGYRTLKMIQFQRYPLANHLFWLAKGDKGGQNHWSFLDTPPLSKTYAETLAKQKLCDTIIGVFTPK
ncbi:class I SAM-dependent methyltransferase [Desulfovibrio sp. JC022]|uniref:class I SAM-dependent methyltransferase n=1 Tax=Desulfovibrio sp. JC022 TaxID=2593642 RepID=UPI0013D5F279|nr:class I SAM-dependent methyltransferase [Desulfovibrio sp. JC022]